MPLDGLELVVVELGRLGQDGVADADLADVVQQRAQAQHVEIVLAEPHGVPDRDRQQADALRVAGGVGIAGVERGDQGADRAEVGGAGLGPGFVHGLQQRRERGAERVQLLDRLLRHHRRRLLGRFHHRMDVARDAIDRRGDAPRQRDAGQQAQDEAARDDDDQPRHGRRGGAIAGRGDRRHRVDRGRTDRAGRAGRRGARRPRRTRRSARGDRGGAGAPRAWRAPGRSTCWRSADRRRARRSPSGPRRRAPRRSGRPGGAPRRERPGAARPPRRSARRWRDTAPRRRRSPGPTSTVSASAMRRRPVPAGQPGALGPALTTTRPSRPTTARPSDRSSAAMRSISTLEGVQLVQRDRVDAEVTLFLVGLEDGLDRRAAGDQAGPQQRVAPAIALRGRELPLAPPSGCWRCRVRRRRGSRAPSPTEIAPSTPTTVAKAITTTRTTNRGAGDGDPGGVARASSRRSRDRQ